MNKDEQGLYSAPSADLEVQGEPQAIGGWLRFFQVINYIGLVLSIVVLVLLPVAHFYLGEIFEGPYDMAAVIIELLPPLVFTYLIIRHLPASRAETPTKIKQLLSYYLTCSLLVVALLYAGYHWGYITEKPSSFLGDIIYYAIWASYFKKSKRVLAYYGANAE